MPIRTGASNGYTDRGARLLKEEAVLEKFRAAAVKEVIALQIKTAMKAKTLTKNKIAELMQTGRAQLDRLLDPEQCNVTA
jgi:antitoxin HicB